MWDVDSLRLEANQTAKEVLSLLDGMETDMVQACSPTHGLFPVPSPLCGMVTAVFIQLEGELEVVPSPPGGMETQATRDNAKTKQNGSEPTVWDGD